MLQRGLVFSIKASAQKASEGRRNIKQGSFSGQALLGMPAMQVPRPKKHRKFRPKMLCCALG